MASTISANVDGKTATKLKKVASLENNQETIVRPGREMMAAAARLRLEKASVELASEHRFGGPEHASGEIDMLDEATALTRST
ncbi:hypothetical protein [Rhizobium sp. GCM10022189]|uniref:hypothetical protein n=1 Tax=Rhizobium sp. GCM10022189 TaxID=3252654 RepID=UPI000DDF0B06